MRHLGVNQAAVISPLHTVLDPLTFHILAGLPFDGSFDSFHTHLDECPLTFLGEGVVSTIVLIEDSGLEPLGEEVRIDEVRLIGLCLLHTDEVDG